MTSSEISQPTLWVIYRAGELAIARESISAGPEADYPIADAPGDRMVVGVLHLVRQRLEERGLVLLTKDVIDTRHGAIEFWGNQHLRAPNLLSDKKRALQL
ncbi:hypothetical protein [Hansschlegelia zhihuaiae]|uniref:Uncharacterized protein n=1 Tax=Hansschlegelia zhihuaiae TaxID=405005 RepID=A0A4Q0MHR6_9HYPH|nr:hypothetical protein [Hansschlegelia zhihuaiae]RXF72945.1 hypothetical protein EK403_12425 [Hansschlegelia zhihuaiae]